MFKKLYEQIVYEAYTRHNNSHAHASDYEVCPHIFCVLAYWLERITHYQEQHT